MLLNSTYNLVSILIAGLVMTLVFAGFFFIFAISQRRKIKYHKDLQQAHELQVQILAEQNSLLEQRVAQRTGELFHQNEILEAALIDLKATQTQLIHRERMASLGELTAGIAHEIQNPLNFVNNFSDVNT